jgi:hypothetical protein
MPDRIRLDIDNINMRFEYLDTAIVPDVEYSDLDMDKSKPSKRFGLKYGRKISIPFSLLGVVPT